MYLSFVFLFSAAFCDGARILAVFPAPFISHQMTFRSLTEELANRGHEVIVITTDPAYKDKDQDKPENLREIDVHDESYALKYKFCDSVTAKNSDVYTQALTFYKILTDIFEVQINTDQVRQVFNDTRGYDLVLVEACVRPTLIVSHIFKAPMIVVSSLGSMEFYTSFSGTSLHPTLYPSLFQQKLHKYSLIEKIYEIYKHFFFNYKIQMQEVEDNAMLRRNFGDDVPTLSELKKKISLLFLNVYHIWENNRPVPPNLIYFGGLHLSAVDLRRQVMTEDLQNYLDSSKNGVIYVSYGSNINLSLLPRNIIDILLHVLSQLPYDILLRWDKDALPYICDNIKLVKWTPQAKLLKHPKIKLFITQGGLQSTDEAIAAAVPVIAMPTLGDQWYNAEQYSHFNIGLRVDFEGLTEEKFYNAINTVLGDESYRRNIENFRSIIHDQAQSSLDRAVWYVEHVLRHKGAGHLKAAGADVSWPEYLELELVLVVLSFTTLLLYVLNLLRSKIYGIMTNKIKSE